MENRISVFFKDLGLKYYLNDVVLFHKRKKQLEFLFLKSLKYKDLYHSNNTFISSYSKNLLHHPKSINSLLFISKFKAKLFWYTIRPGNLISFILRNSTLNAFTVLPKEQAIHFDSNG